MKTQSSAVLARSRSLATLLMFTLVGLSLLLLLVNSVPQLWSNTRAQQNAITSNQRLVAQGAATSVRNFVEQRFSTLVSAGRLTNLAKQPPEVQTEVLQRLMGLEPSFLKLVLFNNEGRPQAQVARLSLAGSVDINAAIVQEQLLRIEQGLPYVSPVFIDPTTNEPEVFIAVPVTDVFGDPQGMLTAIMNLKFMWDLVDRLNVGEDGLAYVVDAQGDLLAFSDTARVLRAENLAHIPVVADFIARSERSDEQNVANDELSRYSGILGTNVVGTYEALGVPDWAVVTEIPWQIAYRGVINNIAIAIAILFGITILAGILGVYLSRRLTLPLVNLMDAANRIAAGERELQVAVGGPREIAALGRAFNTMTAQLRSAMEGLEERVAQRTTDLETALANVETRSREQARLLEENAQQRQAIRELSVPVLPVRADILVMPLIGVIDTERLSNIQDQALQALERTSARYLLLDITGVPVVDTQVARGLLSVAQMVQLLGTEAILIGVRPEVAQTIVGLGLDLTSLRTAADLQTVLPQLTRTLDR